MSFVPRLAHCQTRQSSRQAQEFPLDCPEMGVDEINPMR